MKDFNGEGISWQITENVTVKNSEISGSGNTGLHPGTGSPFSVIENNDIHHNDNDGLFICWRVYESRVVGNKIHNNGRFGICTGHKDTDVLFLNNHIFSNGSEVWSLPCTLETFSQLASALEIVKPGTAIFEMKGRDVVNPAHDLAMSRLMRSDIFPRLELDYENALKYLRKGTPEFSNIDGKWAVAVYKGVNLGFLKNIGNRINN